MNRVIFFTMLFVSLTSILTACGKKGPPVPEEPSPYPRTYPKPITKEM